MDLVDAFDIVERFVEFAEDVLASGPHREDFHVVRIADEVDRAHLHDVAEIGRDTSELQSQR